MSKSKLFLDAGHGGNDSGACGQGLQEKERNLAVAKRVEYHLKRHGHTVIMSRTIDGNPSLTERTNLANRENVTASVSIHCNAFNGSAKGVETYTYGKGANEIKLANCVHNQIIGAGLYTSNRGIKQGNLHMVRETAMAAILIEMAFIDNTEDANLLRKSEDFAIAITKGILSYCGDSWKPESTSTGGSTGQVKTKFRVVCGTYENRANAEAVQRNLKDKGFSSFLVAID